MVNLSFALCHFTVEATTYTTASPFALVTFHILESKPCYMLGGVNRPHSPADSKSCSLFDSSYGIYINNRNFFPYSFPCLLPAVLSELSGHVVSDPPGHAQYGRF